MSVAAVSNILDLAESSRRLPGWPRNNAAHLEAAPSGSGQSDGWGDLSKMSSWACWQGPNQSLLSSAPTDGHPPKIRPTGQGFLHGIFGFLYSSLDHSGKRCNQFRVCLYAMSVYYLLVAVTLGLYFTRIVLLVRVYFGRSLKSKCKCKIEVTQKKLSSDIINMLQPAQWSASTALAAFIPVYNLQ